MKNLAIKIAIRLVVIAAVFVGGMYVGTGRTTQRYERYLDTLGERIAILQESHQAIGSTVDEITATSSEIDESVGTIAGSIDRAIEYARALARGIGEIKKIDTALDDRGGLDPGWRVPVGEEE